ncbi:MAG: CTP synthase, partial [Thermoguttaceae bacterium]
MTKFIFVTGGVVSSLGKGLTSASIGLLLEHRGLKVRMQKLDPYINVDPGKLSPSQHGEVYVLDDGSTTDLDLGHYERFTNSALTWDSSWTSGQIYQRVFEKERRGEYQGATIQVIPHITNEIKNCVMRLGGDDVDVVIVEIGGTVGDIESLPHMEAIRQFGLEVGKENVLYIHLTLVPYLKAARELKTKPTQHSVGQLRQIGIQPDILVCRCEVSLSREDRAKIGLFCNVETDSVIEEKDKDFSIYEVPLSLAENKIDQLIVNKLQIRNAAQLDLTDWHDLLHRMRHPEHEVSIAVIGEFTETRDAYKSIYEALDHAGSSNQTRVRIQRVQSSDVLNADTQKMLEKSDGILVAGSFDEREIEGKLTAVKIARENNIPFLGIGLGMQCAIIEFARNVLNLEDANSTEYDKETKHPVVKLFEEYYKNNLDAKNNTEDGTLKIGSHTTNLLPGSALAEIYGKEQIAERFRHRYEFNNSYREEYEKSGKIVFSAKSPDGVLVEAVEIPSHRWFFAVQYNPQFKSQPTKSHP